MKSLGLYIHIPFCEKKCYYCDFLSFANKGDLTEKYIKHLILELSIYKDRLKDYNINTIFIGGGSPSLIEGEYIYQVLNYIYSNFNTKGLEETTIEINPATLTKDKAKTYKVAGINRISLGVQTLNNMHLKNIGRIHRAGDFYKSYEILKETGFENINLDLIFALPGQTIEDVIFDIDSVTRLDIKHISYYSLILEPGTLMNRWYKEGKIDLPSEYLERQMYYTILKKLSERGFNHYEISNFSKENYECKHNLTYWKIKPYLGVGMSSHSNINGQRFWNTRSFDEYFSKLSSNEFPVIGQEMINKRMEMAEYCIMGIRLISGINKFEFKERFGMDIRNIYNDVIRKNIRKGLLEDKGENIILTSLGLDLANQVEVDFLP